MIHRIVLVEPAGERVVAAEQLPISIGSSAADIRVPGPANSQAMATIGMLDDRLFLQPTAGSAGVSVNNESVTGTRWLASDDSILISGVRIDCHLDNEDGDDNLASWRLRVDYAEVEYQTLPPELAEAGDTISPVRPRVAPAAAVAEHRTRNRFLTAVGASLAILLFCAFYIFTARSVGLDIEPGFADVELSGGLLQLDFGERYLLRTGEYTIQLAAEGYLPLATTFTVTGAAKQDFEFSLEKKPGRVQVVFPEGVSTGIWIDDELLPQGVNQEFVLPAGVYQLRLTPERYQEYKAELVVEGAGLLQLIEPDLVPAWADVALRSAPSDAAIIVNGIELGQTPATVEILAGTAVLELTKPGYKTWKQALLVQANQPQELALVELRELEGVVRLQSQPPGAAVTVDGQYAGKTPLEVELDRGGRYKIRLQKAGYREATRQLTIEKSGVQNLQFSLEPLIGKVLVRAQPADAKLYVDGKLLGEVNQTLELTSMPHRIEVRKVGYESFVTEVTPRPGLPQELNVKLFTAAEALLAATPELIATSLGAELRLMPTGQFQMGTSRREQGRRANEAQREVKLTRPFYIGLREVSNREFREFKPLHTSGAERYRELAGDRHPAVMVSWQEAAAFCNWLSDKDGLNRAYVPGNSGLMLAAPATNGYRLPTEAEWAWVGRYNAGAASYKYPWGAINDSMPPPVDAGNYADLAAEGVVSNILRSYEDGFPVTAPVGSFVGSNLGIFDLGGNVAEWVNDIYVINAAGRGSVDIDPVGPADGRYHVIRGSGWRHASISELRLAYRDFGNKGRLDVGFRLARYTDAVQK